MGEALAAAARPTGGRGNFRWIVSHLTRCGWSFRHSRGPLRVTDQRVLDDGLHSIKIRGIFSGE